jgi:hypothetical protein
MLADNARPYSAPTAGIDCFFNTPYPVDPEDSRLITGRQHVSQLIISNLMHILSCFQMSNRSFIPGTHFAAKKQRAPHHTVVLYIVKEVGYMQAFYSFCEEGVNPSHFKDYVTWLPILFESGYGHALTGGQGDENG